MYFGNSFGILGKLDLSKKLPRTQIFTTKPFRYRFLSHFLSNWGTESNLGFRAIQSPKTFRNIIGSYFYYFLTKQNVSELLCHTQDPKRPKSMLGVEQ